MQGRQAPDRRPMSRGNKLLIAVGLLLILGFSAVTLYPSILARRPQATEVPSLPDPSPTYDPQANYASIDEALESITPTPAATPAIFVVPQTEQPAPATQIPNFEMTPKPSDVPTLKTGSSGDDVRAVQARLIELGYMKAGSNDGVYGKGTTNAVKAFQQQNGLSVDGSAGPKTIEKLFSPDAVKKPK